MERVLSARGLAEKVSALLYIGFQASRIKGVKILDFLYKLLDT